MPVLVVLAKSPFWTADYEQYRARLRAPSCEYETIDGVSHFLMLDKPAEFNAAVVAFLKKNQL